MSTKEPFDYEGTKKKALEQLRSGKPLFGKDGAFAPMLKEFLESALEAEIEEHLNEEQREDGNRKNGKTSKKLKTGDGTIDLDTPRDRSSTFDPQIVRKRETILAESLEPKIIGMYGHGMSLRDISAHIKDMYDTDVSAATLSAITDKIVPQVKEWQGRPLLGENIVIENKDIGQEDYWVGKKIAISLSYDKENGTIYLSISSLLTQEKKEVDF